MKQNETVELFEDEQIVTLTDEEGNSVDFAEVAGIEYEDKLYVLLQPVDEVEDFEEDEVIVCLVEKGEEEGAEIITAVEDEELAEKVFEEYLKAVADELGDCPCDDCGKEDDENCMCGCNDKNEVKEEKKSAKKKETNSTASKEKKPPSKKGK
ncbi:MAG: DUF1292 domain-containing protein [Firmicutes bacterium]|nr:DUF1292 domain-containing protein [Bacillota bacterium]